MQWSIHKIKGGKGVDGKLKNCQQRVLRWNSGESDSKKLLISIIM